MNMVHTSAELKIISSRRRTLDKVRFRSQLLFLLNIASSRGEDTSRLLCDARVVTTGLGNRLDSRQPLRSTSSKSINYVGRSWHSRLQLSSVTSEVGSVSHAHSDRCTKHDHG